MANVLDVARFFIDYGEKSEEPMTNLRINKMLFLRKACISPKKDSLFFLMILKRG